MSQVVIWRENTPGRGKSKCKGFEAKECLKCSRKTVCLEWTEGKGKEIGDIEEVYVGLYK